MDYIERLDGETLRASIGRLQAGGLIFADLPAGELCEECGCPLVTHEAVMPVHTTRRGLLLDPRKLVECPDCLYPGACGTWSMHDLATTPP
jgi:hypothetical protein